MIRRTLAAIALAGTAFGFAAPAAQAAPVATAAKTSVKFCAGLWIIVTPDISCGFALNTAEAARAARGLGVKKLNVYSPATRKRHPVLCIKGVNKKINAVQAVCSTQKRSVMLITFP